MLYVDIPTLPEIQALIAARADASVSIYVSTTPHTQDVKASRIAFGNLTKEALEQLDAAGFDKRRRALLAKELADLGEDDAFWRLQAHSLAVLATPDSVRTFRLATAITDTVEVSDRFHFKPLLRAIAFPQNAFVLALSEGAARLVEVFADLPPSPVHIHGLPKNAGDAVGRASINNLTQERESPMAKAKPSCCANMRGKWTPPCGGSCQDGRHRSSWPRRSRLRRSSAQSTATRRCSMKEYRRVLTI